MIARSASSAESLLDELQATLTHGTVARRVEALRRVTDLFLGGAVDYSDEQVALFDDVFKCLIDHMEVSARALLANRLARIDNAPRETIRTLAFDDVIEVAGPVLSNSPSLNDDMLIEAARSVVTPADIVTRMSDEKALQSSSAIITRSRSRIRAALVTSVSGNTSRNSSPP